MMMKLKSEVGITFDEMTKMFMFEGIDAGKMKKVTSRHFPTLLGENKWNSVASAILDRCGLLEREEIDPYYMVRGAIGEILVQEYVERQYKSANIDGIEIKRFTPKDVGWDMFKKNNRFGGVVDLAITAPPERRAVIEVKSKSMKDKAWIAGKGNYPTEEVMQGLFLGVMSKVKKTIMAYIFFSPDTEASIRAYCEKNGYDESVATDYLKAHNLDPFDTQKIVIHMKSFSLEDEKTSTEIETKMEKAFETLQRSVENKGIWKDNFSEEEQAYLMDIIKRTGGKEGEKIAKQFSDDDLPF
jgi:hypothetical protein